MTEDARLPSSFRDPSGFVYKKGNEIYRFVSERYRDNYTFLKSSGLLAELQDRRLLVGHKEEDGDGAVAILKPEIVPFISYPYEWCFSQLKDAALATLEIQRVALDKGMSLKDASAFNIQFLHGKPILLDTLSFEIYKEGAPWVAYKQFCQHFLAPLALMALVDIRLGELLRTNIDGIPVDLASRLLPSSTKLRPGLLIHIHSHAKALNSKGGGGEAKTANVSRNGLLGLIDSLKGTISSLHWEPSGTTWGDYYDKTNYTDSSMQEKHRLVEKLCKDAGPNIETCWDLGANTGEFSSLAANRGLNTIAWDFDPAAVEKGYRDIQKAGTTNLLPLLQDLTNPSPALGWASAERDSLTQRGPADLVLALALVHHLAIGNNVPWKFISSFFASCGTWLIVEFVAKEDSQVLRLLQAREDIFDFYNQEDFEVAFSLDYEIVEKVAITGTLRTLYLMKRLPA